MLTGACKVDADRLDRIEQLLEEHGFLVQAITTESTITDYPTIHITLTQGFHVDQVGTPLEVDSDAPARNHRCIHNLHQT